LLWYIGVATVLLILTLSAASWLFLDARATALDSAAAANKLAAKTEAQQVDLEWIKLTQGRVLENQTRMMEKIDRLSERVPAK
jgi:hypothetical protein